MDTVKDFSIEQHKYIPDFPRAGGKLTAHIEGYPFEDDEPMAATAFHGLQITTFFYQLLDYFDINPHIHVGVDTFIYYCEGDISKVVSPDIYVVFGVDKYPLRYSFYTWAEGVAPVTVFEFLTDSTAHLDRDDMANLYLRDIGVQEYFIHQPEMDLPSEFRGWRRGSSGEVVEIVPDVRGSIFSKALNLWFRWEDQMDTHVRLLRPFLPDGTLINTPMEDKQHREAAEAKAIEEQELREVAEAKTAKEQELRRQEQELREVAEAKAAEEQELRRQEQELREVAEAKAAEGIERQQELEAELEQFRAQLANVNNEST